VLLDGPRHCLGHVAFLLRLCSQYRSTEIEDHQQKGDSGIWEKVYRFGRLAGRPGETGHRRRLAGADWKDTADVRQPFRDADFVGGKVVFKIAQNRYRLIARVACRAHKVFIKAILTHKQYGNEGI